MKTVSHSKNLILSIVFGFLSIGVLWGAWEYLGAHGGSAFHFFPPPTKFFARIMDGEFRIGLGSQSATMFQSIFSSIFRVFAGLGIGFAAALLVGTLVSCSVWLRRLIMPVIQVLAPIAPIAWIPLAIVMLGLGNQTAIFIVFMGVFFTLTIATVQAVDDVPEHFINSARTLGCNSAQIGLFVIVPYILPKVFTILRLNFIAAWMAVLAAEMTGLRDGLGAIIMIGRNLFDNNLILLGMFLIGVCGFLVDAILKSIQSLFLWWGAK